MGNSFEEWQNILNWDTDIPLKDHMHHMRLYLLDIARATEGRFTEEKLIASSWLLDVGMGNGALGAYLRDVGMNGKLIGVNDHPMKGDTGYHVYDRVEFNTIQHLLKQGSFKNERFDHIVCIAPPNPSDDSLLQWMLKYGKDFPLSHNGQIVIASEKNLGSQGGYSLYQGISGLKYIYLLEN